MATNPPPTAPLLSLPGHDAAASAQPTGGSNIQRLALIVAVIVEAILLFLNTGTILLSGIQNISYPNPQQQPGSVSATLVALSVIGLASFLLPVVIGALAHSWRAAVALPILAVWAAAIVTVASLFFTRPSNVGYLSSIAFLSPGGGFPGLTDYWLSLAVVIVVPLAFLLFGALGWIGWVGRRALSGRE